ncbi:MAG: DUF484 family protein [Rhodospirillaceae bacterium]
MDGDAAVGSQQTPAPTATVDPKQVLDYLRAHPEFLSDHPELLIGAALPSRFDDSGGTVIDFRDALVGRLRREITDLSSCAEELITNSKINHDVQKGTMRAALALLDSDGLGPLMRTITEDLPHLLDVDVAVLRLEHAEDGPQSAGDQQPVLHGLGLTHLPPGQVTALLGLDQTHILRPQLNDGEPDIYGDQGLGLRSDAIIRLDISPDRPDGVLALGCREVNAFTPDMAVDMLSFIARVIENCLRRWMPQPGR